MEIRAIKDKWLRRTFDEKAIKPAFLGYIAQTKGYRNPQKKKYDYHKTTMDYLLHEINLYRSDKTNASDFIPLSKCFKFDGFNQNSVNKKQISKIIQMCETATSAINAVWSKEYYSNDEKYILAQRYRDDVIYDIQKMKINKHTFYMLIVATDMKKYSRISKMLFHLLFNSRNDLLKEILNELKPSGTFIRESNDGEIEIFGIKFKRYGGINID